MSNPARVRAELLRLQAYLLEQRFAIMQVSPTETGRFSLYFAAVLDRLQALVDTTGKYGESFDEALYRQRLSEARTAVSTLARLCVSDGIVFTSVDQLEGCLQTLLART